MTPPAPDQHGGARGSGRSQNVGHISDYRRKTANGDVVTTWPQAHRIAMIAAGQAHRDLGVDTSSPPIDIASAIVASGAVLMWTTLPRLFGMYVNEPGARPGIAVNSGLPHGARRQTAAHELGHRLLGHATGTDDGDTIDTAFSEEDELPTRRRAWPDHEKVAESFAAWFLMPRLAVRKALACLSLDQPRSALDVYRLSLILGTSYRTTLRHLPNLKLMSPGLANQYMRIPPGRLKAQLDDGYVPPASRRSDVWLISPTMTGVNLEVRAGDRIVLDLPGGRLADHPDWLCPVAPTHPAGMTTAPGALECLAPAVTDSVAHAHLETGYVLVTRDRPTSSDWSLTVNHRPSPQGIDQRCLPALRHPTRSQEHQDS